MLKLPIAKLDEFFAAIAAKETLYLPVDNEGGQAQYKEWKEGVSLSRALNTVRSAKDFFFPQTENLMEFKTQGKTIEVIDSRKESEDFVIFGVRACDARSFTILDKVFLVDPVDTYYKTCLLYTSCNPCVAHSDEWMCNGWSGMRNSLSS